MSRNAPIDEASGFWALDPAQSAFIAEASRAAAAGPIPPLAAAASPLGGMRARAEGYELRAGVAIVPLTGPIMPSANALSRMLGAASLSAFMAALTEAVEGTDAKGAVIVIDSPGGLFSGIGEAADAIRDLSEVKPIAAYVAGNAASAAYWLASAAPTVIAHRSAFVGGLGIAAGVPVQERADRDGYRVVELVSANAAEKRPDPRTDTGRSAILAQLDAFESEMLADIARLRGVSADRVRRNFGRGGLLMGQKALAAGMVDRVGRLEDAIAVARGEPAPAPAPAAKASAPIVVAPPIVRQPAPIASAPPAPSPVPLTPEEEWQASPALRAEFLNDRNSWLAFKRAVAAGLTKE
ncbi:MAG: S49 family peptidase [Azospirillaceae bacterium]